MAVDHPSDASDLCPISFADAQHGSAHLEKLRRQRVTGRFCDVLVIVGERHYAAHRCVLAAASPYFDAILRHNKVVKEHVTVTCQNSAAFELLLNYIYSGGVTLDRRNVIELLKLANNFLVTKLKCYCAEYLDRYLDARTCLAVKELSTRFNMPVLAKTADNYLLLNPNECVEQATDVERYPINKIETLLSDHTLRLRGDVQMSVVLRWIKHDVAGRNTEFKTLLPFIRLADIGAEHYSQILDEHPAFVQFGHNRLALYAQMNEENLLIPEKHAADYAALLEGRTNGTKGEEDDKATVDPSIIGDRVLAPGEQLDYIPIVPSQLREELANAVESPTRAPLKLSIKIGGSKKPSETTSSATDTPPPTRRRRGDDGVRGRPSKAKREADAKLAAEHEVAEMTLAASLGDDDDEFATLVDDGEMGSDEFSEVDDEGEWATTVEEAADRETTLDDNTMLFKCPDCIYMTRDESRMQVHVKSAHKQCPRVFVCGMCDGWQTRWNHEYYKHMQAEHFTAGPPFKCDLCTHTAIKLQHILSHRLRHTNHKAYGCAFADCDYRCRLKSSLVVHQRQHTGERPFKCDVCQKAFAMSTTLDQHMSTHNPDRPFQCEQCPFSTKYQSHLISHKRIHTGDVFHCTYTDCTYNSPKKSQLAAHLRTHLAVREHTCPICSRSFIEKSHLVRHERIHLIEKPFKCDDCEYASSRRDKLKEHIQKHHGAQSTLRQKQRKYRRQRQLANLVAKQQQIANEQYTFRPISVTSSVDTEEIIHGDEMDTGHEQQHQIQHKTVAPTHPIDALLSKYAPLTTPSPAIGVPAAQGRPSSAMTRATHHRIPVDMPSPALSLNFNVGFDTPTFVTGGKNDVLLSTQQAPTPTLNTPTPRSPQCASVIGLPTAQTPSAELNQRPMSMPSLVDKAAGGPGHPSQYPPSTQAGGSASEFGFPNLF